MSVNDYQVGGNHYAKDYQHWDWVHDVLDDCYHLGCATKYVVRWRDKNGLQDLRKAVHYVKKIVELDERKDPKRRWSTFLEKFNTPLDVSNVRRRSTTYFCESNGLGALESIFVTACATGNFSSALTALENLITFAVTRGYSEEGFATVSEIGKPVHPKFVWEGFTGDKCEWQCCACHSHVTSMSFTKPGTLETKYGVPSCPTCDSVAAGATPAYVNQDGPLSDDERDMYGVGGDPQGGA